MEQVENTGLRGIRLIQSDEGFRYGIDAVLLADYAAQRISSGFAGRKIRIAELGSGNGIVSLVLAEGFPDADVTGIELQKPASELAERSCALNRLEDRARFVCCDVKDLKEKYPELCGSMDIVVSNPPYVPRGSGLTGSIAQVHAARQETTADLEDFMKAAAWLLKDRGHLCMVHRPSRLVDIFALGRGCRLEPKRLCLVHPKKGAPPNILLTDCVRNGGRELVFDNPIYVYNEDGTRSLDIVDIYERNL